jgi:multidrug efflux pump subunit AcrA (membrane-fusion protein)
VAPRLTGASRGGPGGGGFSGGGGMAFAFVAGGGGQMTITKLVSTGTRVKAGDVVVEFDPQDQERAATEQENQFKDYEEQIKRIVAEQEATKAADDTSLEQARNAVSAAKLELRKNEVISKIDAEKNQQNLEEAEARLKQLQQTYNLKRAAAQAALRITEIQRERSQKALEHARDNMQKMAIRTEMDGMVVISTNFNVRTGVMTDVQEGDQVNAGSIILQVVNPDKMEVRARINQADIAYLRDDAPVKVRLDAYPDLVFNGRVDTFSAIATTSGMSSKVRYFNARFAIDGSDPKLLPDLSAAVDVELDRIPNALVLPRDAIFYENDQAYVNVQRGGGWEKRAVKLGKSSDYEIVVESGVQAGEVVQRAAGRAQGGVR